MTVYFYVYNYLDEFFVFCEPPYVVKKAFAIRTYMRICWEEETLYNFDERKTCTCMKL